MNKNLTEDGNGIDKEEFEDITTPYDVTKIDIIHDRLSVDHLFKRYRNEELILNPDFQRNEVWKDVQKSRLIESVLIKIPIPAFYIDARDEEKWIVIDGLQRLSSIFRYVKDEFKLKNLEFLKELEGKKFKELERKFQRRIEECQLILYTVRPNTPEEIAFNIFTRINTLGSPLSNQEIRHAIYQGKSTKLLTRLADSTAFKAAVSPTPGMVRRMNDKELILRLLAFKIFGYKNYQKSNNLSMFLSDAMKKINKIK